MKKDKKGINLITNYYSELTIVIVSLQTILVLIPISILINVILLAAGLLLFAICKESVAEGKKKLGFVLTNISVVLFAWGCCSLLVNNMQKTLGGNNSLKAVPFLLGIIVLLIYGAIATSDKGKELMKDMYDNEFKFALGDKDKGLEPGDVVLGVDKKTGKDIILHHDDRFLHLLALGATGTGKTSQILLPMIYQDMQNLNCGMTILEPKSDLAEKTFMLAKHMGRNVKYFNPTLKDCPYFNPLYGPEEIVIENMATTFGMFDTDSSNYFRDMADTLIRNGLRVVKRLYGNDATLLDFATILFNADGQGKNMVMEFKRKSTPTVEIRKENDDVASWFLFEYYNEKSKTYEHCSGLRTKVNKLVSNKFLRKVLNPPKGTDRKEMIDFDDHLATNSVLSIATEQGVLGDLGNFLGFFLILAFQSSVLRRPGNENTRMSHFFYVDEVQVFANTGFSNLLTQGRSYRVSSNLATQALDQLGMNSGKNGQAFIQLVTTNARNIVLFPGCNGKDAKYYSDQFGEHEVKQYGKSISKSKFNWSGPPKAPSETKSEKTVIQAMYSPSDLIFREFGEVTVRLIKNKTLQYPQIGVVSYIPREINQKLDEELLIYKEENKYNPHEALELMNEAQETEKTVDAGEDLPIGLDEILQTGEYMSVETQLSYEIDDDEPEGDIVEVMEDDLF